jgi:predicted amidophosphoribosyltransferase
VPSVTDSIGAHRELLETTEGKNVVGASYGHGMLRVLFPLVCPGCGGPGAPVCPGCTAKLHAPVAAAPPPGISAWWAPFAYEGVARELVARVKYRNVRAVVPWLADAMADVLVDGLVEVLPAIAAPDLVTWAPTSRERRRSRGFDPAELLARAVARRLGLRVVGLLDRLPGPPQTGLPADARRRGPHFVARRRTPGVVLVVDDIATTGATLTSAAGALRGADARVVVALTAARTPPPS